MTQLDIMGSNLIYCMLIFDLLVFLIKIIIKFLTCDHHFFMMKMSALIAFLVSLAVLVNGSDFTIITVSEDGHNEASCVTDVQKACQSLDYTLHQIEISQPSTNVTVNVTYSHFINPINVSYLFDLNLTVLGHGTQIDCSNYGYIYISAINNANVSVAFNGLSFHGCLNYRLHGFHFKNIDSFTITNSRVINCNDMHIESTGQVYIRSVNFTGNYFFYAVINLEHYAIPGRTLSTVYLLENLHFINNFGMSAESFALVAIPIQSSNNDCSLYGIIKNCVFANDNNSQSIGIVQHSSKVNFLSLTIGSNVFLNQSVGIFLQIKYASLKNLNVNISDNKFINDDPYYNKVSKVFMHYSSFKATSVNVIMNNNFMTGVGTGISVNHDNVANPGTLNISNSLFKGIRGSAIIASCSSPCSKNPTVVLSNVIVDSNLQHINGEEGVVVLKEQHIHMHNCVFANNTGTALYIENSPTYFSGYVNFTKNAGFKGGAMAMYGEKSVIVVTAPVKLFFYNNLALYGAGIYIGMETEDEECFIIDPDCQLWYDFQGNIASSGGENIFVLNPTIASSCVSIYLSDCSNITGYSSDIGFGSSVMLIDYFFDDNSTNALTLFPGQSIPFSATLYDVFHHIEFCIATVYLQCTNQIISCTSHNGSLRLLGPTKITLSGETYISNLKLLMSTQYSNFANPTLRFSCPNSNEVIINLNIVPCPLGFAYNESKHACECIQGLGDVNGYVCSQRYGQVCVFQGYWYGNLAINDKEIYVLKECQYLYCGRNDEKCPVRIIGEAGYVLLPTDQDDQCKNYRGGVMCSSCKDTAIFSFEGIQCIPLDQCKLWQPYVLLVLVIFFQLGLALLIKLMLNIKFTNGLGFLYSPLFFVAVINQMPFGFHANFYVLKIIVSLFSSILLLNMEVFGQIPWCFFSNLSALDSYGFRCLGPLIVGLVLLLTVLTARKCPKLQRSLSIAPLQAVCLFILLSFWSLTDISINVLNGIIFSAGDIKTLRVKIEPQVVYFSGKHIPFALTAIVFQIFTVVPFIAILTFSPCLSKKFNLSRLKPMLDQFQSCYQDRYRFFPGLYPVIWYFILVSQHFPLLVQALLIIKASIHFVCQPYRTRWLNVSSIFLICDLIMISALLEEKITFGSTRAAFIYILTLLPLIYICIGCVVIVMKRISFPEILQGKFKSLSQSKPAPKNEITEYEDVSTSETINRGDVTQQDINLSMLNSDNIEYREPLLALLPNDDKVSYYNT